MNPIAKAERKQNQNKVYWGTHSCLNQHQAILAFYVTEIGSYIEDITRVEENTNLKNILACPSWKVIF